MATEFSANPAGVAKAARLLDHISQQAGALESDVDRLFVRAKGWTGDPDQPYGKMAGPPWDRTERAMREVVIAALRALQAAADATLRTAGNLTNQQAEATGTIQGTPRR
ncbi:hypothetical protein AB0E83_24355 [Streptomyces sp. NPDC035033]|uniref:hypothetical protein n=1 Tax=Streptomyces sp. NPDC035033 TaxID=3155368 RepID=UPI003407EB65